MKSLLPIAILWLLPWGLIATALVLLGRPGYGITLGLGSLLGVTFVLALARAAKGN